MIIALVYENFPFVFQKQDPLNPLTNITGKWSDKSVLILACYPMTHAMWLVTFLGLFVIGIILNLNMFAKLCSFLFASKSRTLILSFPAGKGTFLALVLGFSNSYVSIGPSGFSSLLTPYPIPIPTQSVVIALVPFCFNFILSGHLGHVN